MTKKFSSVIHPVTKILLTQKIIIMNEKLLPIEEFALQNGNRKMLLALLQSVSVSDNSCGFRPTRKFIKEVFKMNDRELRQILRKHFQDYGNSGYDTRNKVFVSLCCARNAEKVRTMLKTETFYLQVPQLQALFSLNDRESEDLYFKEWLPVILHNPNFYDELDYLKESNRLDDLKARYQS